MLPPALSLCLHVEMVGSRDCRTLYQKLERSEQMRPGIPIAWMVAFFERFCASVIDHDSLSEMGRRAEPWKSLEGKGLSLATPGWQMSLLSLRGAGLGK